MLNRSAFFKKKFEKKNIEKNIIIHRSPINSSLQRTLPQQHYTISNSTHLGFVVIHPPFSHLFYTLVTHPPFSFTLTSRYRNNTIMINTSKDLITIIPETDSFLCKASKSREEWTKIKTNRTQTKNNHAQQLIIITTTTITTRQFMHRCFTPY